MTRHRAILLIGPTGSGKTPLGDLLELRGLWQRPCYHFDFGRSLRRAADGRQASGVLTAAQVEFVRDVLQAGRLLEDEDFGIAEAVLTDLHGWTLSTSALAGSMSAPSAHFSRNAPRVTSGFWAGLKRIALWPGCLTACVPGNAFQGMSHSGYWALPPST